MRKTKTNAIDAFIALSAEQKKREWQSVNREFRRCETLPLTPAQRAAWNKFRKRRKNRA